MTVSPVLPAAELTDEDELIWWRVRQSFGAYPHAHIQYDAIAADIRDAEIMRWAQTIRRLPDHWAAVRGWLAWMPANSRDWIEVAGAKLP